MGVNYVILKLWNPTVDHIVLLLGPDLCPDMMVTHYLNMEQEGMY